MIAIHKPSNANKFSPKLFISVSWLLGADKTPSFLKLLFYPKHDFLFLSELPSKAQRHTIKPHLAC